MQVQKQTEAHTRLMWTCSWSHDDQIFATGSKQGEKVWAKNEEGKFIEHSKLTGGKESTTALAFFPA